MMENKEDYKIYSTVEKQEVEWLWYPYIPYGYHNLPYYKVIRVMENLLL